MKKGLSLVVASALAFSTFSTAFADEATMDAQAKFDALKAKGIFEGRENGAELDKTMTRAEFAKVIVKLLNLQENASGASAYTDLDGAGWAKGYIGAVTPKYMEGVATGKFDPSGQVTLEQMATILVRALGLQVDESAKVDGKVSDWAKGYVAAAIKAGIIKNSTDFTKAALRSELVESTYASVDKVPQVIKEKASGIAEAKQSGGSKITVKLDGAADTEKAKFEVTLNGSAVEVSEVKWADNKASADLTLESKLQEATYVVTLSGIDGLDSAKAKAEVKAEAEKVTKIDFVTASEVLPIANEVRVEFKVINQFGEDAKIPASNLKIKSTDDLAVNVAGESAVKLDLDQEDEDDDPIYESGDRISITITHEDSQVSVNKIFTVGDEQNVTKIEIGKLLNSAGKEISAVDVDDDAYLQVTAYDQYGFKVMDEETLVDDVNFSGDDLEEADEDEIFNSDVDNDNFKDLKFHVDDDATIGDHTITLYASGGSVSKTIKVGAPNDPYTVEFGSVDLNLAEGDGEESTDSTSVLYKKYVPIIVKNADGVELTKDEIVAAAENGKLTADASGSAFDIANGSNIEEGIVKSGVFKGQIALENFEQGSGTLTVELDDYPEKSASINLYVNAEREVEEVRLTSNNGDKGIQVDGVTAESKFKFKFYDNNNAEAKDKVYDDKYYAKVIFSSDASSSITDTAKLTNVTLYTSLANAKAETGGSSSLGKGTYYATLNQLFDEEFKLRDGVPGVTYKVKVQLMDEDDKVDDESDDSVIDEVTKTYEVLANSTTDTYTWTAYVDKAVKDGDKVLVHDLEDYDFPALNDNNWSSYSNAQKAKVLATGGVTPRSGNYADAGKEIKISAKDGNETILVPNVITAVYTTNSNILTGYALQSSDNAGYDTGRAFVFGWDTGDVGATVTFKTNKTGGKQTASIQFTVDDAETNIATISDGVLVRNVSSASEIDGKKIYDESLLDEVVATDSSYGNTYSKAELYTLSELLGIQYIVTEQSDDGDSLTIDADGTLHVTDDTDGVGSFTIKIVAPSGAEQVHELGYGN